MRGPGQAVARLAAAVGMVAALALPARAQQKLLTIDDLYDPATKAFGASTFGVRYDWLSDTEYVKLTGGRRGARTDGGGAPIKVDAASGAESPLFDTAALQAAIAKTPGVSQADAGRASRQRFTYNPQVLRPRLPDRRRPVPLALRRGHRDTPHLRARRGRGTRVQS